MITVSMFTRSTCCSFRLEMDAFWQWFQHKGYFLGAAGRWCFEAAVMKRQSMLFKEIWGWICLLLAWFMETGGG